jgi:hypothetical protein
LEEKYIFSKFFYQRCFSLIRHLHGYFSLFFAQHFTPKENYTTTLQWMDIMNIFWTPTEGNQKPQRL